MQKTTKNTIRILRLFSILGLCLLFSGCSRSKREPLRVLNKREQKSRRPRLLICTSNGGGGHASVVNALTGLCASRYDVAHAFVIRDVLDELDPIRWMTGDRLMAEDLYNFFLTHGSAWFANALASYGCYEVRNKGLAMKEAFGDFIRANDPDLVISVMPYINGALLGACRDQRIPFMIVPCDYNGYNYMNGLDLAREPYDLFRYAVPLDDELVWYELARGNIPRAQTPVTGFAVRPSFIKPEELDDMATRARFAISSDRPVVLVMMGAAGGNRAYGYVKALMKTKKKMHIVVVAGRNEKLKQRLLRVRMPESQFLSVVGFTDQIAQLMHIADVMITKPGPTTLAEAFAMRIPMVLDVPSRVLYWEEMNIDLVKKYKVGAIAHSFAHGARLVTKLLAHPEDVPVLAHRMAPLSMSDTNERIMHEIETLLQQSNTPPVNTPGEHTLGERPERSI